MDELLPNLLDFLKANIILTVIGVLGVIIVIVGVLLLTQQNVASVEADDNIELSSEKEAEDKNEFIIVDVEGAVNKPGVYEMDGKDRMKDIILKAGGIHKEANSSYVSKSINMASKLTDGMKIYIPFADEDVLSITQSVAGTSDVSAGGLININTASDSQLDSLPGVGPATVTKIVANRPYASVDELLSKKSVGSAVFEKIKDSILTQ